MLSCLLLFYKRLYILDNTAIISFVSSMRNYFLCFFCSLTISIQVQCWHYKERTYRVVPSPFLLRHSLYSEMTSLILTFYIYINNFNFTPVTASITNKILILHKEDLLHTILSFLSSVTSFFQNS